MKSKIYIETTIISYLASRMNRDLIIAAHQELTHEWWKNRRNEFDLFISQLVIQEAECGDKKAAQRRLNILEEIPLLEMNENVLVLSHALVKEKVVPEKAVEDALRIATATIHGMDYLLTWNCKHIANAEIRYAINTICQERGYIPPIICTPEELMGE